MEAYRGAIDVAPNPEVIKWKIASLAKDSGDRDAEMAALSSYIVDPKANTENIESGIGRLLSIGGSLEPVKEAVVSRIREHIAANNVDMAMRHLDIVMAQNLGSAELYRMALTFALRGGFDDRVKQIWWRGLTSVTSKSDAGAYLEETMEAFEQVQKTSLLLACFREGLIRKIKDKLPKRAYVEYLTRYGLLLFDNESQRKKATVVMRDVHELDPQESRVWMPLYFLLTDYGMPAQRLSHLDSIVPQLIHDQRPLRSFPLTLESLKAEREELQAQLSGVPRKEESFELTDVTGLNRAPPTGSFESEAAVVKLDQEEVAPEMSMPVQQVAGEPHYGDPDAATQMVDTNALVDLSLQPEASASEPAAALDFDLGNIPAGNATAAPVAEAAPAVEPAPIDPSPVVDLGSVPSLGEVQEPLADSTPMPAPEPAPLDQASAFGSGTGEVSMVVDMADMGEVSDLDLSQPGPGESVIAGPGTEQFDAPATMADADFTSFTDALAPGPGTEIGVSAAADMATSVVPQNIEELPALSEPSLANDVGAVELNASEELPDGLPPIDHQAAPGAEEIVELDAAPDEAEDDGGIPKPRTPQLYGDLFEDDENGDVDAQAEQQSLLPEPEEAQGTGQFKIEMNADERERTGNASSVELAAALGMDEEAESVEEAPTALVESAQHSAQHSGPATAATSASRVNFIDWRNSLDPQSINPKLTRKLLNQAFANEVEKHVALQSIAVLAANCEQLNNWHWRVWRKPDEYGYDVRGKERFPESEQKEVLQSSTAKLILATAPVFVKLYKRRFTTEYLSRKLKVPVEAIEKNRQPFSWRDEPMSRCGFIHYAGRIKKRGYKLFDLPGLRRKIFYEIQHRTLYIDRRYYASMPPSHLFHRVLSILWSVRMQYFVPLTLNPKTDAFPIIAELAEHFNSRGMTAIKSKLKGRSDVIKALDGLKTEKLKDLYGRVGIPRPEVLNQLWFAMQTHVYMVILAETLDLVGLLESIVDKDLLEANALQPGEILRISPYPQHLIDFVTKIDL